MKNNLFTIVATLTMIGFLFSGCNDDDNGINRDFVFNLDKYFELEEGTVFGSTFPEASDTSARPIIESITGNNIIPNGGKNSFTIVTSKPVTTAYIGVLNESSGYYGLETANNGTSTSISFQPEFVENPEDKFYFLKIAVVDEEGFISDYDSIKIVTLNAAIGEMKVECTWDQNVDIDLYLIEPLGDTVFFNNPVSEYNGRLNHDSNPFCWIDGLNEESIMYDVNSAIQTGNYRVLLRFLSACETSENVAYSVSVFFDDQLMTLEGQNPVTGTFISEDISNNPAEIFSFSISGEQKAGVLKHVAVFPNNKPQSLSPAKTSYDNEVK